MSHDGLLQGLSFRVDLQDSSHPDLDPVKNPVLLKERQKTKPKFELRILVKAMKLGLKNLPAARHLPLSQLIFLMRVILFGLRVT